MRVCDKVSTSRPSTIIILLVLATAILTLSTCPAESAVQVNECTRWSKLPGKCRSTCLPDKLHGNWTRRVSVLVRPNVVDKCKTRRRTAWVCEETVGLKTSVEFFEDFPDWDESFWKWRTEDIRKLHLLIHVQSNGSSMEITSDFRNSTSDWFWNDEFAKIYLEKATNNSCFQYQSRGNRLKDDIILDCTYWGTTPRKPIQDIYIGLLFIASAFLLITVIVYVILWDHQSLHGWTVFSEVLSNFFMIVSVGLAHYFVRDVDGGPPGYSCVALALISHFFFLSTFFWMTAINFNLWKTFRKLKTPVGQDGPGKRRRNIISYINYTAFAIGVPFLLVFGSALLDFLRPFASQVHRTSHLDVSKTSTVRPDYGKKFCYMAKDAQGHFIYYPIGTLIVINSIFFGLTVMSLLKHRKETKVLHNSTNRSTKQRKGDSSEGRMSNMAQESPTQSIILFAKLFCIMGVSWVFEIFAWAFSPRHESVPVYWIIYDVTNLVQAIAVFVIFVCKKDVISQLKGKFVKVKIPSSMSACQLT